MKTSLEEIPLTELVIGSSNVGHQNLDQNIDGLATNIKTYGLLEPIIVFKNKSEKYEILVGQRRYNALLKLDKEYPGEGFDKIPCRIIVLENVDDVLEQKIYDLAKMLEKVKKETPMNAGHVDVKKVAKNKTLITPAADDQEVETS